MSRESDEQLVSRVRSGEVEEFRKLVNRYTRRVYSLGLKFFRNREDAQDFLQEAFVRAYQKLEQFRGDSRFYSWLMRVAYSVGLNALRKRKTTSDVDSLNLVDTGPLPEEQDLGNQAKLIIQESVLDLPERYRTCVEMFFYYGLSYPEISEMTGTPVNTIKSHVFRAKKLLRDRLAGTSAEEYHEL
jgi:RNA polymerase sigma-70 factor (ECF subfamily)